MIIYNLTVKVDSSIAAKWLLWMKQNHITALLETKCFYDAKLYKLMDQDESEGPTYCIQYFAENREDYELYLAKYSAVFRAESFEKWGNKFIAFRSVLQSEALN